MPEQNKKSSALFTRFVQVGRVAFVAVGRHRGKLCVIVDVIDQTRVLVDGPLTGVRRHAMRLKWIHLTGFVVKISPSARAKTIKKAWAEANIDEKWQSTTWYKKLESKKRKDALTDFERFKLMIAKKKRGVIIEKEYQRLKNIDVRADNIEKEAKKQAKIKENKAAAAKKNVVAMKEAAAAMKEAAAAMKEAAAAK